MYNISIKTTMIQLNKSN